MKVIISEQIHPDGIKRLQEKMETDVRFGIKREELLACIDKYDAMIVRADTKVDCEVIDAAKNLKVIGTATIGLNHIDTEYAAQKGIKVYNCPEGSIDAVAELTIALMLNLVRKVTAANNSVKLEGRWDKNGFPGIQLKGKTLGIIAVGKIGSRVAGFGQAFMMNVLAFDPYLPPSVAEGMKVELVSLDELLQRADIVSIHAPLTKDTYHLIGEKEIRKMKPGSYILNLGRGGVVDEEALYKALKDGHLAGAAADVMEKEPPGRSNLFELDNFIITPHIGAGTIEAQQYITDKIVGLIFDYLKV
jgi:D-3-phosphoglycerate dehydrogenase